MAVNLSGHDLRPILRCLSKHSYGRDALHGICRIALQQGRFGIVRIGRYDSSTGQLRWIAEVRDERSGNHVEAASVAILTNGSQWGVLSTFRAPDDRTSAEDLEYLQNTCFVIGLAIEARRILQDDDTAPRECLLSALTSTLGDRHSLLECSEPQLSKSEFLATVAHELRSPLTSVIGFTGMLLQKIPGPLNLEQQRQLEIIRTSGRRLLDLIKDILDLAKLALGQTGVQSKHFDLNDTLRLVATRVEPMAAEKHIVLLCELPKSPTHVVSDPRLIEQLMSEFLDNAIKFTDRGQVKLTAYTLKKTLSVEADALSPIEYACIQIADTGIGIAPSNMRRLFTAFGHAGRGKAHENEGSHLGLAICKGLIDLLRGSIHVESTPAGGSIFTIHLPVQWTPSMT